MIDNYHNTADHQQREFFLGFSAQTGDHFANFDLGNLLVKTDTIMKISQDLQKEIEGYHNKSMIEILKHHPHEAPPTPKKGARHVFSGLETTEFRNDSGHTNANLTIIEMLDQISEAQVHEMQKLTHVNKYSHLAFKELYATFKFLSLPKFISGTKQNWMS